MLSVLSTVASGPERRTDFDSSLQTLPSRELAVLAAVAEGKSDAAIAATLDWPLYRVERAEPRAKRDGAGLGQ